MEFIKDFNKTAIIFGDEKISYEEFIRKSKGYSKAIDIEHGERVMIFSENRPELLYSFFAIWEKGGTCINIDFSSSEDELEFFIKDSKPSYIISSKDGIKKLQSTLNKLKENIDTLYFDSLNHRYDGENVFIKTPDLSDPCIILYTSGTTGDPKGVVLTYKNLESNFSGLKDYNIFTKNDIVLDILPLHHIFPLIGAAIMPLHVGATVVILKELSLVSIKKALQENSVSMLVAVPKFYNILFKGVMEKIDDSRLAKFIYSIAKKVPRKGFRKLAFKKIHKAFGGNIKLFISGGAKIDPNIVRGFQIMGFDLIEGYGMTECAPMISFTPPKKIVPGSAGKVLKGCEVKIADDGEILVKGPNIMKGYFENPEATNEIIGEDGWLHTGDLGEMKNGYLFITGRKKEMIVLPSGKNINPIDLELEIMSSTELIEEMGIIEHNNILTAIIYPNFKKIKELGINNIMETIKLKVIDKYNAKAPSYKKILSIKLVKTELPKTRIGKLKRFKLKDLLKEFENTHHKTEEPGYTEYKALKKFLKKRKGDVLPDHHLELDVGLDSLDIVELFSFIEENFGIRIDEKIFSENPTVGALAEFINKNKTKAKASNTNWKSILKLKSETEFPKSAIFLSLIKLFSVPAFKLYFRFEKSGLENIPKSPCIFAGNHQSFLDGLMVNNALTFSTGSNTFYLAKIKHFEKGILKHLSKNANILTVDINKNLTESLQKTAKILSDGKNVVIFPEGMRTRDGKLNEFKKTFAMLSKELNVPVVPFAIKGSYSAFPFGTKIPKPKKISIKFFKKIDPNRLEINEIIKQTMEDIRNWISK